MKKVLLVLASVAAFAGSAVAADMAPRYTKAPPPPPLPVVTWTGCYLGGGGGYGLWDQENTNVDAASGLPLIATNNAGGRGWFGTVQGGCDYQFGLGSQQFVIGGFADYDFDSLKGTHESPFINGRGLVGAATANEKMTSAWSVGGRVGWLVFPSLLTYFSGGYTEAMFNRQDFFVNLPGVSTPAGFFLDKATYHGWFLGAGDEYALTTFLPGLFWKTEYRVSEYDTKTLPFLFTATGLATINADQSHKWVQTVRSELVYRFNWSGVPVAAKY
jgi:outer membrane immunogenic protein